MKLARTTAALLLAAPVPLALAPAAHAATVKCRGEVATIVGTPGRDFLTGTSGSDVIVGRGGNDVIDGGGGGDVICGGPGRDRISGGEGNDRLSGNSGLDTISDGNGDDRANGGKGPATQFAASAGDDVFDAGSTSASFMFGQATGPMTIDLAAGTAVGLGNDILRFAAGTPPTVEGSRFGDTLLGSSGSESLWGGDGVDTINGRGGGDNLVARAGSLIGGDGGDSLVLLGAGTIDGGAGADSIDATGEVARIDAGTGDDRVHLEAESGVISSLPDLSGGEGHDALGLVAILPQPAVPFAFDLGSGSLQMGDYTTTLPGFEDFRLIGVASSFDITGTDGPNHLELVADNLAAGTLRGLGGDDVLIGSAGDDVLDGGPGTDKADGRDGSDTCTGVESRTSCEAVTP